MKNEIIKTTFTFAVLLGVIMGYDASARQNTIEAIFGAATILGGLIGIMLERIVQRIEITGAAIVAALINKDWGETLNRAVKREMKNKEKKND